MNVMIGYDGSDSARDAIQELQPAADVAGWQKSPIVRRARALAEQAIAEVRQLAAEGGALVKTEFPGWTVSHATYVGSPYGELVRARTEKSPDLIVVGSQGRSALGRLVLGSVSQNVMMHAPCSV